MSPGSSRRRGIPQCVRSSVHREEVPLQQLFVQYFNYLYLTLIGFMNFVAVHLIVIFVLGCQDHE